MPGEKKASRGGRIVLSLMLLLAAASEAKGQARVYFASDVTGNGQSTEIVLEVDSTSLTMNVWAEIPGGPSNSGTVCENGNGAELCGADVIIEGTESVDLEAFSPASGLETAFNLDSTNDRLRLNALSALSGVVTPVKLGVLTLSTGTDGAVVLRESTLVDGGLRLQVVTSRNLARVPEPGMGVGLGVGAMTLLFLGRRQREGSVSEIVRGMLRVGALALALNFAVPGPAAADTNVDWDADGHFNYVDNCPYLTNATQTDRGGFGSTEEDRIGDSCQCGDVENDGGVNIRDLVVLMRHLSSGLGPGVSAGKCSVTGSPDDCTQADLDVLKAALAEQTAAPASVCRAALGTIAAPTALKAVPGDGRILLDWEHAPYASVSEYQLYRGTAPGVPATGTPYQVVPGATSSFADTGLTNGSTYYYTITAVDGLTATETSASNEVAMASAPAVGGCSVSGDITSSTTWSLLSSPCIVTADVVIRQGATLTIEPGVEVLFNAGASLSVGAPNNAGTMRALGSEVAPIVLRSFLANPGAGDRWEGVYLGPTATASSVLDFVTIRHAGIDGLPSLELDRVTPGIQLTDGAVEFALADAVRIEDGSVDLHGWSLEAPSAPVPQSNRSQFPTLSSWIFSVLVEGAPDLSLTDLDLAGGIRVESDLQGALFEALRFSDYQNRYPNVLENDMVGPVMEEAEFSGHAANSYVFVRNNAMTRSAFWPKFDYRLSDEMRISGNANPVLSLAPGTRLLMEQHADIILGHKDNDNHSGGLVARGTAVQPIVFSGWSTGTPSAGIWPGVTMHKNADPGTRLEHVRIEFAGQDQTSTSRDSVNSNPSCGSTSEVGHASLEIDEFTPAEPFGNVVIQNYRADAVRVFGSGAIFDAFDIQGPTTAGCGEGFEISDGSRVVVRSSQITGGVQANSDMPDVRFEGVTFRAYGTQHDLHANVVGRVVDPEAATYQFQGSSPRVTVRSGTISRSAIWPGPFRYRVSGDVIVAGPETPILMLGDEVEWFASKIPAQSGLQGALIIGSTDLGQPGGLVAIAESQETEIEFNDNAFGNFTGISFLPSALPGSIVKYARIENPGGVAGVIFNGHAGEITLENSRVVNPTGDGIRIENASPRLVGNTISTTLAGTDDAIDCIGMGSEPVIRGNTLTSINGGSNGTGNLKLGVRLQCNGQLEYNTIAGFHRGIQALGDSSAIPPTTAVIRNNHIEDAANGAPIGNLSAGQIDARLNWWGSATSPVTTGGVDSGEVVHNPWLGEVPNINAPAALRAAVNPWLFPGTASGTDFVMNFPLAMNWFIDIGTGIPLTPTFSGTGLNVNQSWNGLGNGNYQFEVRGATQAGAVAFTKIRGTLEVNDVLPEARIDAPGHLVVAAAGDAVAISGEVDSAAVSYALEVAEGYSQGFASSSPGYALLASGTAGTGAIQSLASWNTTGLAAGAYTLRLRVIGVGGTTTDSASVLLLSARLPVVSVPGISPNGDQVLDRVNVSSTITMDSNWTLDVLNGSGGVVKSTSGTGRVVNYEWAGDLTAGGPAPDGPYRFKVTATEPASAKTVSVTSTATTAVDLTAPTASISAPTQGTPIVGYGPITVTGSANDSGGCSYSLSVGAGESPVAYTPVGTGSCPKAAEALGVLPGDSATYAEYDEGLGRIKLRVVDQVGNAAEIGQVVQFDRLRVDNLSIDPEVFNPESGAQAAISFELNRDVLGVTVQVLVEATRANVRSFNLGPQTAGTQTVQWDGRDGLGALAPSGAYLIQVTASADGGRLADVNSPTSTAITELFPNWVNPPSFNGVTAGDNSLSALGPVNVYANESVWTRFVITDKAKQKIAIRIPSTSSTDAVTLLDEAIPRGTHEVAWDGRTAAGAAFVGDYGMFYDFPRQMSRDSVFVKTAKLSPNEWVVNPYLIRPHHGQVATVFFETPRTARARVRVNSPGGGAQVAMLFDNLTDTLLPELGSGPHFLEWDGRENVGTTTPDWRVVNRGIYEIELEVRDEQTLETTTRKLFLHVCHDRVTGAGSCS